MMALPVMDKCNALTALTFLVGTWAAGCAESAPCALTYSDLARRDGPCAAVVAYVWDGERCRTLDGCACYGPGCSRYPSLSACRRAHSSCGSLESFPCGPETCVRGREICVHGDFEEYAKANGWNVWDGRSRCVPNGVRPHSCQALAPLLSSCTDDGAGGLNGTLEGTFPCGLGAGNCARGLEVCEIIPQTGELPIATCRGVDARFSCTPPHCRTDGRGAVYAIGNAVPEWMTTNGTFKCGESKCIRGREVCMRSGPSGVGPASCAPSVDFGDCIARGFRDCADDYQGARYSFKPR